MRKDFIKTIHFLISAAVMLSLVWAIFPFQTINAKNIEVEPVKVENDTNNIASSSTKLPAAPKKRALLVGISKYCRVPGECGRGKQYWWDLNTEAEVGELARILKDPNGQYKFDEVRILKDAEATHQNIVNTFTTFLINQTNEGDIAYFHYSGHGGQVPDDTAHGPNPKVGDEIDGYDETIIPIDYTKGKTGFNDIRDDEIGALLEKLQAKKPGNTTLTFDSCFSGTIQRGGDSVVRGSSWEGKPVVTRGENNAKEDSPSGLLEANGNQKGGYVIMSATRNDQVANETPKDEQTGKPMGVFTSALTKALRKAGADTTYRDIFQSISDDVSRSQKNTQNPQLEGQLDQKLMSGTVRNPSPYLAVTLAPNDQDVILKAGKFMGVTTGSEYAIYENGKESKGMPLAKAVVELTADLTAKLKITPAPSKAVLEKLKTGRAVETKHGFGDMRLKVDGDKSLLANRTADQGISDLVSIEANAKDADVRMCPGKCPNELPDGKPVPNGEFITLQRNIGGSVIARVPKDENSSAEVLKLLESEARWRFFNTLKDGGDPNLNDKVKIRLVPVKVTETKSILASTGVSMTAATKAEDLKTQVTPARGGRIELKEGDLVMLEVANLSDRDLYITVIDVQNNGKIKPFFPHPMIPVGNSSENKFSPTGVDNKGNPIYQRIPCPFVDQITPQQGMETYRVIATTEPADYSALFTQDSIDSLQRGEKGRGLAEAKTPFGRLLMSAMTGQLAGTRGEIFGTNTLQQVALPNPALTISSITFDVKPE